MRIVLINIDSKLPNLALVKLEMYYQQKGYEVVWNNTFFIHESEKTYVSCIFTKNKNKAKNYMMYNASIGGSGYDLMTELPKEIYSIKPRINMDFSTRGCIRKCDFCIVPEKEGNVRAERDLYDIWDGKSKKVTLLDNNILALPEHFELICSQATKENIQLDFNQGLDIRLVNDKIARMLSKQKLKDIRFALDYVRLIDIFNNKLKILERYSNHWYFFVYVYVCKDYSWEDTMERLLFLKKNKCRPYLMRDENVIKDKEYIRLARWVNQQHLFQNYTWDEFVKYEKEYIKRYVPTQAEKLL